MMTMLTKADGAIFRAVITEEPPGLFPLDCSLRLGDIEAGEAGMSVPVEGYLPGPYNSEAQARSIAIEIAKHHGYDAAEIEWA